MQKKYEILSKDRAEIAKRIPNSSTESQISLFTSLLRLDREFLELWHADMLVMATEGVKTRISNMHKIREIYFK